MRTIDYEKYAHMTQQQLLNSLSNAQKKEQKIKSEMAQKLNSTQELIQFLKAKIKEGWDKPPYYTVETSPAMQSIQKDFEALPQSQQSQMKKELERMIAHGGNDEHHPFTQSR